jgi:PAS domain S-box-containing protein
MPGQAPETDLQQAMELFERTTSRLRSSYERLQEEVRELRATLEDKDRELGNSRAERDRLAGYLAHLLESVPSGVVATDPEGRITTLNRAAQEITGLEPGSIGRAFRDVFPLAGGNGGPEPDFAELEQAPRSEVTIRRCDGDVALLGLRVSPFRGDGGEVLGRVVVFQDVTRLKRLEEQEARNRRLVAMGEMAAGIAHEIRNPLGSLELFASHLTEELRGSPHDELSSQILKGVQNLSRITGNLLLFARKIEPRLRPTELADLLSEALLYAKAALSAKGVALSEAIDPCTIEADSDLLRQVFLNLLLNAVQAVSDGGTIRVSCRVDPGEDPPVALVRISDDGPGVPAEGVERIFDPFYTTRANGMGLGLAIVQRIVSAHGGWVAVGAAHLGGAEFTVGVPTAVAVPGG